MAKILVIDLGTSFFKFTLFDRTGRLCESYRIATPMVRPQEGWMEIPTDALEEAIARGIVELGRRSNAGLADVEAVTFATQTNSFLLLDSDGRPLVPVILWPDNRAVEVEAELQQQFAAAAVSATAGIPRANHQFMPAKLLWLRRHRPETWARMDRICLISDYLTLLLTGQHVTEAGAAGLTGLVDIVRRRWSLDWLTSLALAPSCLPAIVSAGTALGAIVPSAAERFALPKSCRLIVGCLDQYAGAIGVGNVESGMLSETTGTVLATVRCVDRFSAQLGPGVFQGPAFQEGLYWQMAFGDISANLLQWYRDQLPDRPEFEQLTTLAEPIEPGAEGLRLRLGAGLTTPAEVFSGLTARHTRGHAVRCILEAVAGALADQAAALSGGSLPGEIRCAGGAAQRPVAANQGRRAGRGHGRHDLFRAHEPGGGHVGRGVAPRRRCARSRSAMGASEAAALPRPPTPATIPGVASDPDPITLTTCGACEMTMPTDTTDRTLAAKEASTAYLYSIVLVAAVGGFLFGYDLSLISGAVIFLKQEFALSPFWFGAVTGSAVLGCPFGPLAGVWLADNLGRKWTLIVSSLLFAVSTIGCAAAGGMGPFIVWRFVGGMGVGLASTVSPMYIAEVAPAHLRGRLVVVNQLAIVIGLSLSVFVTYLFSFGGHWRWMFATQGIPVACLMIGLLLVPESPRWLATVGRFGEALRVLAKINGRAQAEKELKEIQDELGDEPGGFGELLRPGIRLAAMIGILLMVFSQINGVNMILIYTPTLFMEAGITTAPDAILNSVYIDGWITLCTVIAFWLTRTFGRRSILICGTLGMAAGHLLMFLSFTFNMPPLFTLAAMFVPTGAFTLTLAPLSWVVLSEIFPNRVRGKAMSLATCAMFASSYATMNLFPMVWDWFKGCFGNPGATFLIFFGICLACSLFVWLSLPETKDKTLEEIGDFWLRKERT